jgi:hypothetical protein
MIKEYVGGSSPTAHATLNAGDFNLEAGGKTLLKGFPSEAGGYRSDAELFHFYSAPGADDFINVYGGYVGVGDGVSGSTKLNFGSGKPTVLATLETPISSDFLKIPSESDSAWLSRISGLSGKTGIAPETLGGQSMERQFVTPAAYNRGGVDLPGSLFVSKGGVRTYQIQQLPAGRLGEIPILRSMFSKYTNLRIVLGSYAPVEGGNLTGSILDVGQYNKGYVASESIPVISVPSAATLGTFSSPKASALPSQSVVSLSSPVKTASINRASTPKYSIPQLASVFASPISTSKVSTPSLNVSSSSTPKYFTPQPASMKTLPISAQSVSKSPLDLPLSSISRGAPKSTVLVSIPSYPSKSLQNNVSQAPSSLPKSTSKPPTQSYELSSVNKSPMTSNPLFSPSIKSTKSQSSFTPSTISLSLTRPPPSSPKYSPPPHSPPLKKALPPKGKESSKKQLNKIRDSLGLYQRRTDKVGYAGKKMRRLRF